MVSAGEARSTPMYSSMASPRPGGCVSAFLHFFDWTPARRFASTRRLSGQKPEKVFRRSRSFRGEHGSAGKTRMMCRSGGNAVLDQAPRAPGVVARLMGLESLPQPPRHRRSERIAGGDTSLAPNLQRGDQRGTPILLQDLLRRDYKASKRSILRNKIPAIFPRRAAQEEPSRFRKKSVSILTAFRCRPEVSCVSPAYFDIPATSRFLYSVARSPRSSFLSRLPPGSQLQTPHESPSCDSTFKPGNFSVLEEKIPELGLRATSAGTTVLLQGWPLESQRIVPPDIFHEDYEPATSSPSVGSRPASSKVVQGRRRGSSRNGSASAVEQDARSKAARVGRGGSKRVASPSEESVPPRRRSSNELAFKTTRRPSSSKSHKGGKRDASSQPLMPQEEDSRTSISQESVSTGSLGSISSKSPTAPAGKSKAGKPGIARLMHASTAVTAEVKSKEGDERRLGSPRSKELALGKPPPKVRTQNGIAQQESSPSRVFPVDSPPQGPSSLGARSGDMPDGFTLPKVSSYGVRLLGGRKEGDKPSAAKPKGNEVEMGPPPLASPPLQRFPVKPSGVVGGQAASQESQRLLSETKPARVQDFGARLKAGNVNGEDMATQNSGPKPGEKSDDIQESTSLRCKRKRNHGRAPSVDDVFPELPLDFKNSEVAPTAGESSSLTRPVERALFRQGISSTSPDIEFYSGCDNGSGDLISGSPLIDFSSGACMPGRLSASLVDYDELPLPSWGEYGTEAGTPEGLSSSPLIDCDELRSVGDSGPPASSPGGASIPAELCQVQEADDWEDEAVEAMLDGRCCERSCSGPSISSESLPSDTEDERNGDTWSSCASYNNLGDGHSPRSFEIAEIEVELASLTQEHQNSPPAQFVKKIPDAAGLDTVVDEAGQPSPVSILDSPFLDEACTASESSPIDSIHRQVASELDELDLQPPTATTNVSNSDRIRQALLDISMFRSREESCALEAQITPETGGAEDEQSFVRGVLSAAHFLSTPGSSPDWHDKDVAIDPSFFDKLESGDIVESSWQAAGGLWRCDRKLLFDCVNEAFGVTRLWHCQGAPEAWLQEELVWRSSRPRGELLVAEVVKRIEEWRMLASFAIDSLIEWDMSAHFGSWKRFGPEVAELGLEVEDAVWEDMLEEVLADMIMSPSKRCSFS